MFEENELIMVTGYTYPNLQIPEKSEQEKT